MSTLGWIISTGIVMSAIALIGSVTLLLKETTLQRIMLPLVAFAAGSLIGGAFFHIDIRLGLTAWLAAAAHEIPQELGDFAVLINGGWSRRGALVCNAASALTFLLGGIVAYAASFTVNVDFLVPFAAGNFLYIGASDLVPEVNKHRDMKVNLVHLSAFVASVALMWTIRVVLSH